MSKITIRYKLNEAEYDAFMRFMTDLRKTATAEELLQLTPEKVAKQCLFLSINDAYDRARKILEEQEKQNGKATSGDSSTDSGTAEVSSGGTDSDVLAATQANAIDSRADSESSRI
jgi:hypothetical protein